MFRKILVTSITVYSATFSLTAQASDTPDKIDCTSRAYLLSQKEILDTKILTTYGSLKGFKNLGKIDKKMRKGSYKSAQKLVGKSLELPNISAHLRARFHAINGEAFAKSGDIQNAVSEYSKAHKIETDNAWLKKRYKAHIDSLKNAKSLLQTPKIAWLERDVPPAQMEVKTSGYCYLTYQLQENGTKNIVADFCDEGLDPQPFINAVSNWRHNTSPDELVKISETRFFTKIANEIRNECGYIL